MKTTDALSLLDEQIQKAAAEGVQTIELAKLREYAQELRKWHEEDERAGFDAPQQAIRVEEYRRKITDLHQDRNRAHETSMEVFRSGTQAGQNALRTCLLINGGAAVALLAFTGHLAGSQTGVDAVLLAEVADAMGVYVVGVLACGLASGATYLSQWLYHQDWEKTGLAFNIAAIIFGSGSLVLFGIGGYLAYTVFAGL